MTQLCCVLPPHVGRLLDLGALRALTTESEGKLFLIIPRYSRVIPAYKRQKWIDMDFTWPRKEIWMDSDASSTF